MTLNPLNTCFIVLAAAMSLTGCAGLNSQISDGQYSYQAKDVDIKHFGINYSISLPIKVGDQDLIALTHATDCEAGNGTLQIRAKDGSELASYPASTRGSKGSDKLFKHLCDLNPKLVRIVRGCS
jgi:major membrane immunogen (membrane-anchored lipoprotein)